MKTCSKCSQEKTFDAFSPYKKSPDGLFSWCKQCNSEATKARYELYKQEHGKAPKNKRKPGARAAQSARYWAKHGERISLNKRERYASDPVYRDKVKSNVTSRRYGLGVDEYREWVRRPCEICGSTVDIVVDHCHTSNKLRGSLCGNCNTGLGMFSDSPEKLQAAIDYLLRYNSL